jgi:alkylhydroperoxidase/carboxymuconolactone decarboxylase family protein YurZ
MMRHPLSVIQENDVDLFNDVMSTGKMALSDGALPAKYKLLTALALDAAEGAANGVKSLAAQAMAAGATKEEIFDTLRVVYHICGAGSVYTAASGLESVFGKQVSL